MATFLARRFLFTASVVVAVSLASFIGFGLSFDPACPVVTNYRAHQFLVAHYHLSDPILSRYWH